MNQKELPEWTLPYFSENYTGPYLSDGKIQSSVANGRALPKSRLDILSRDHDTAYNLSTSDDDRRKADRIYHTKTRGMSFVPRFAGDIVLHGNDPMQLFSADGLVGFNHLYSELGLGAIVAKMGLTQSLKASADRHYKEVMRKEAERAAANAAAQDAKSQIKATANVTVSPNVPEGPSDKRDGPTGTVFVQSGETPQSVSTGTVGSGESPGPSGGLQSNLVYDPNKRASQYDTEYGGGGFAYNPKVHLAYSTLRHYDNGWPKRLSRKRVRKIRVLPSLC